MFNGSLDNIFNGSHPLVQLSKDGPMSPPWMVSTPEQSPEMFQRFQAGVPVQPGVYPPVKAEDPDHKKPAVRYITHVEVFNDLSDPKQIERFREISQDVYDGRDGAQIVSMQVQPPVPGCPTWSAFIFWRTSMITPANQQGVAPPKAVSKKQVGEGEDETPRRPLRGFVDG